MVLLNLRRKRPRKEIKRNEENEIHKLPLRQNDERKSKLPFEGSA